MRPLLVVPLLLAVLLSPLAITAAPAPRELTVTITDLGYEPDHLEMRVGEKVRLTFVRELDDACAAAVVLPEFHIRRDLPLHERVTFEVTPQRAGEFTWTCGMGMMHGTIVVRGK